MQADSHPLRTRSTRLLLGWLLALAMAAAGGGAGGCDSKGKSKGKSAGQAEKDTEESIEGEVVAAMSDANDILDDVRTSADADLVAHKLNEVRKRLVDIRQRRKKVPKPTEAEAQAVKAKYAGRWKKERDRFAANMQRMKGNRAIMDKTEPMVFSVMTAINQAQDVFRDGEGVPAKAPARPPATPAVADTARNIGVELQKLQSKYGRDKVVSVEVVGVPPGPARERLRERLKAVGDLQWTGESDRLVACLYAPVPDLSALAAKFTFGTAWRQEATRSIRLEVEPAKLP